MFNFIKSRFATATPVIETQRQTIDRALSEVNEILAGLDEKPSITFDPQTGAVSFDLPKQMPDEALALPAPTQEPEKSDDAETAPAETDKPA